MKDTGLLDRENKSIYVDSIVKIYSMNHEVGMGEVVDENGKLRVTWFGEWSYGLVRDLNYLVKTNSLKVIEKPLYMR